MTLAAILDAERSRRGLSVEKLAELAKLPRSGVYAVLNGTTADPRLSTVVAILGALGKSLSWLDRERKK